MIELTNMKANIYCRVSTQEQARSGYSLDAQEKACRAFGECSGFLIDRVFREEGESAKTTDRTELFRLIKHVESNTVDALIIWKLDRLARNITDQGNLIRRFAKLGTRVLSATENNEESATGNLTRNIAGVFAQFENELKAERTVLGMKAALKEGRWLWRSPIGYRREVGEKGRTAIVPGPYAPLIQKAYKMLLEGFGQADITRHLKESGLREVTQMRVRRILRNPIYCGIIRVPWFPVDIPAEHVPIISKDQWDRAQHILAGRFKVGTRARDNPELPLRRFVRCGSCGTSLTGAFCKGRHGGLYPYYFCRNHCPGTIRKAELESRFYEFLKGFEVSSGKMKMFLRLVREKWAEKQKDARTDHLRLSNELRQLNARKDRLNELVITGTFDEETYRSMMSSLRMEVALKQAQLHDAQADTFDLDAALAFCGHFITHISSLWLNATARGKIGVQNVVFPQGVKFSKNCGFQTPAISLLFKAVGVATAPKITLGVPKGI